MKKYIFTLLIIISFCIISCKKNTSSDILTMHNIAAINYGDECEYEDLYNQLYAAIDTIKDDSLLNAIVEAEFFYADYTLDDIIGSSTYDQIEETSTYIWINEIVSNFFGLPLEAMSPSEGAMTGILSEIIEVDYIEPSTLYNLITSSDLTESDIFMLYFMSAAHNYVQEQNKVCIIAIEDANERKVGIFPIRNFPQLPCSNEPIVWHLNVEDVHMLNSEIITTFLNPDSHIDSTRMDSFESIGYYLSEWFSEGGSTYADAADCYLTWMQERDAIREECYARIEAIASAQPRAEDMQKLMNACLSVMYAKLEAADWRLEICLAAVYLNNNQQQQ